MQIFLYQYILNKIDQEQYWGWQTFIKKVVKMVKG